MMIDIDLLRKRYAAGQRFTVEEWAGLTAAGADQGSPDPRSLIAAHDMLLFVKAFPHDAEDHLRAVEGLARISSAAAAAAGRDRRIARALRDSGIDGLPMRAHFSIDLCRWLLAEHPSAVVLDAFDGEEETVRATLVALSQQVEREAMDDERHTVFDRLLVASAGSPLRWLVNAIDRATGDPHLRHVLWEGCRPGIVITPHRSPLSRTFCQGPDQPIYYFHYGTRGVNGGPLAILGELEPDLVLGTEQRGELLTAARGVLIGHQRETDPVTCCEHRAIAHHRLDQGIGISLLPLPPGRRTALDAYVGYVAYVNRVPVAYGGAWLFPGRTKVGINVFPAFRGGPSALLFARILRCYAQRYAVDAFEAENYQLGHGNGDGIRSGAYWFYHRLGFRSQHPRLAAIAAREAERMRADPGYRTPARVLRKLAAEPMLLRLREKDVPHVEPLDVAERALHYLAKVTKGDRHAARERIALRVARRLGAGSMKRWSGADRSGFADLAPAIDPISDLERWSVKDKRLLVELMRAKGRVTEDHYIALLNRHQRLIRAWWTLLQGDQ